MNKILIERMQHNHQVSPSPVKIRGSEQSREAAAFAPLSVNTRGEPASAHSRGKEEGREAAALRLYL